jgi:hypothetical protein
VLQHPPHAVDVLGGVAPVALRVEIAELDRVELARAMRATPSVILRVTNSRARKATRD